jgi:hypothetical protein
LTPKTNGPPVLGPVGDKSVDEGARLGFTISATDPDDDALTYSVSNLPEGASFDTQTRTFSWIPSSGQAGTYPDIHFEVSDRSLTDSEDITITVKAPPVQPDSSQNNWWLIGGIVAMAVVIAMVVWRMIPKRVT